MRLVRDPPAPESVACEKTRLRLAMRRLRFMLAGEGLDAATRAARLLPLDRLPPFLVVGGYHAVGAELDPLPLIDRLRARGAMLALPVAIDRHAPVVFRAADEPARFAPDAFGIPAPAATAAARLPDLVIAPVLAFDRRGGRLGQGAGCYDRTLAALRARSAVFVIGLAYTGQEIDHVPVEPHDQALDAILTESGYTEFRMGFECA